MLELLEGAENGRYKVIAKAEPYKNLPVRLNITHNNQNRVAGCQPKFVSQFQINFFVSMQSKKERFFVVCFSESFTYPHHCIQPAPVTPEYEVTPPGDSQFLYDWGGR